MLHQKNAFASTQRHSSFLLFHVSVSPRGHYMCGRGADIIQGWTISLSTGNCADTIREQILFKHVDTTQGNTAVLSLQTS